MKKETHNRGGGRPTKIKIGNKVGPVLSFGCFESRHEECNNQTTFFSSKESCQCSCHKEKKK